MQKNNPDNKDTELVFDKLVHGYDVMLEQLSIWAEKVDENAGPLLTKGIEDTEKFMFELEQWTKEEIDLLSHYLKRDIHDAAFNLEKQNKSLTQWLQVDIEQVETKLLDIFSSMTDQTRMELGKLSHLAEQENNWHTGDITSVGTLECKSCGTQLHFHKAGRIPPCPKCHKTEFIRSES